MADPDAYPSDIPYLRTLRDRLWAKQYTQPETKGSAKSETWTKLRILNADLEQLPYTLQGAYESAIDLAKQQQWLLERLDSEHKLEVDVTYLVSERDRNSLGYCLDTFIEISRRCQNATTLYVSRTLGIQLPASLRDCVHKLAAKKLDLPEELAALIRDYWAGSGKTLRAYRDLSQHHLLLSSDVRASRDGANETFIFLVLPNNPEEKSMRRLSFSNPVIHALPYVVRAYQDLYRFCFLLSAWLLAQTGEVEVGTTIINLLPRTPFGASGGEAIQWIEPLRISSECWRQRRDLEKRVRDMVDQGVLVGRKSK